MNRRTDPIAAFCDTPVCRFRETASNSLFDGLNMLRAIPMLLCVGALASTVISRSAVAASQEQIMAMCMQSLMPKIMACAQAKGLRGDRAAI